MSKNTLSRRAFVTGAGSLVVAPYATHAIAQDSKPNIVFILADDLGYADLSIYGRREYRTPHIDALAKAGMRFTQAYANSCVCSPTRFALITGRYQYRLRGGLEEPIHRPNDAIGLPASHPTLPSLLKRAGYETALFGKWHLGFLPTYSPLKSGYDEFFGNYGGAVDYFTYRGTGDARTAPVDLYEGEMPIAKTGYYTHLLADRAVEYISKKRAQPFFLSMHFTAPHWPWEGPNDEAVAKRIKDIWHSDGGSMATYAEMITSLDSSVGRILAALRANKLERSTIVVFTSDNGGERFSDNWPFSGQKHELLEGGIRVPAAVRWLGKIKPAVTDQVTTTMDWLPTLLAAAGTSPDASHPSDGENILPILLGQQRTFDRTLYWRFKSHSQRAVRSANLKYLRMNGNEYLFDLSIDPRERGNLAATQPEIFAALKQQWEQWNATMLPITDDVFSGTVGGDRQADRYLEPAAQRSVR